jgi:hypothetical protein
MGFREWRRASLVLGILSTFLSALHPALHPAWPRRFQAIGCPFISPIL